MSARNLAAGGKLVIDRVDRAVSRKFRASDKRGFLCRAGRPLSAAPAERTARRRCKGPVGAPRQIVCKGGTAFCANPGRWRKYGGLRRCQNLSHAETLLAQE